MHETKNAEVQNNIMTLWDKFEYKGYCFLPKAENNRKQSVPPHAFYNARSGTENEFKENKY